MPGTRGRRDPSLLAPTRQRKAPGVIYVVSGRPLNIGTYKVPAGVEVPGAAEWPRVEAWIGARAIRQLAAGEEYTLFADFTAKVDAEDAVVAEATAALEQALAEETAERALLEDPDGAEAPVSTE